MRIPRGIANLVALVHNRNDAVPPVTPSGSGNARRSLEISSSNCGADSVERWIASEIAPMANKTVDPYFLLDDIKLFPEGVDCSPSQTDRCNATVHFGEGSSGESVDSLAFDVPCTRCVYEYPPSSSHGIVGECRELPCDDATCLPDADGKTPYSAQVCVARSRYDSFSSVELRASGQCLQKTVKKVYANEYLSGVKNVRHTELIIQHSGETSVEGSFLGSEPNSIDEGNALEICEFIVDGTSCNSCRFCTQEETVYGDIEIDCSNVNEGAVTSCDSLEEGMSGINPATGFSLKLLTLQDGYVHTDAPTGSPTAKPISEGPQSNDKLVVDQAHDDCVIFNGRAPQLRGDEIEGCKLTTTPECGSCTHAIIECNPRNTNGDLKARYESSCKKENGRVGESPRLSVTCTGSGLLDLFDDALGEFETMPRYARASFHFRLYECYANDSCLDAYDFNYEFSREICEAGIGYQRWLAGYLEDQYRAADIGPVECSFDQAYFHPRCCTLMESGAPDFSVSFIAVAFSMAIVAVMTFEF